MSAPVMAFEKTRDAARGKWKGILQAFGVEESFLKNEHGPCPLCKDGKDRFRFDDLDGDGTYYCSQCGPGSGLKMLMVLKNWTFERAAKEVDGVLGTVQVTQRETKKAEMDTRRLLIRIWQDAKPIVQGDPVWRYLERRGADPVALAALKTVRHHPALKHSVDGGLHPAMLALLEPNQGKAVGIHRTYLTPEGIKAAVNPVRMVLGECAAVRLGGSQERLGVAEGIETALCASRAFRMPVWSALNANGMKTWEPPEGVTSVVVFGDNDSNFTGQDAAFHLAHRLKLKGLEVRVEIPPTPDTDWADVQLGGVA